MSTVLEEAKHTEPKVVEALYTICPVFVASNVAVELGWFDEEFKRVGAKAVYLRSLANNAGWIPHYTHGFKNLFRDGGAIPTIQSRADRTSTKLIGLTWAQRGGQILVRANSGIHRVADLKGRKIGLFRSLNTQKIDFVRATAHRGILLALELAGLTTKDVQIVDLEDADTPKFAIAQKPAELWAQTFAHGNASHREVDLLALSEGRVDAIYSNPGRSDALVKSGQYTVIEDLANYPDWTLQVANGPYTTAVNTEFAEAHPEVIVAFLRAAIRAGRWINEHRAAAAEIFTRVTFYPNAKLIEELLQDVDLVPQLSPKNLAAIDIQKKFLIEHGYVKNDFDVNEWADHTYLEEALASLK
ncbi:MAG: nitrate ABC transporter substrate-binding protein [Verrucomicrobia bacterium Tous-C9LFEB]|nr:MAG: nitrate ABC transporter substrate-binding protein [Verrucomicrobia bacterium Tous-C9LFEB]